MRVQRDLSGDDLRKALGVLVYEETRQTVSHVRMTTRMRGEHHVTVPNHKALPAGTIRAILRDVARHFGCTTEEIVSRLLA